jgi:hypothetical protein
VFVDVTSIFISSLLFAPAVGVVKALHLAGMVEGATSTPQNCLGSGAQSVKIHRPITFARSGQGTNSLAQRLASVPLNVARRVTPIGSAKLTSAYGHDRD